MPSRARTTSEGNHIPFLNQPRYLLPHRPMSIGSPITPPSAAGSTDSAGSSTSIDDEHWHDSDILGSGPAGGRCAHSLTPDEPIVEENGEDMVDGAQYLCHRDMSCVSFIPRHTHSARSDDGYVDMSPSNRSHPPFMSPTASLSSVTSGTPSTDIRFVEYMLEKVPSYLTNSEDEGNSERPIRAYSFGSRSETTKCRTNHQSEAARERAYSFGAKTKRIQNRILPPYGFQQPHNNGAKSSSAPLLLNCRLQGSHSSLNSSNNYHVEMDFSKPQTTTTNYVDMGHGSSKTPSGYVEMKPGIPPDADKKRLLHKKVQHENHSNNNNNRNNQDYVDMTAGTSPGRSECYGNKVRETVSSTPSGYMDMNLGKNKKDLRSNNKGVVNSPLSKSPLSPNPGDYMDMNCNNKGNNKSEVHYSSSPVKSSISPNIFEGSPSSIEYIDVEYPASNSSNDGYVEMTPGKGVSAHRRQTSLDGTDDGNSDYTNMTIGSNPRKRERKNSRKEQKIRSQPIQIIQTTNPPAQNVQLAKGPGSSSSPSFCSWTGRKFSTGTPPKMCLPLSNSNYGLYSSLPRTRSRRNSRRDSKDSSTSSATTPSSSSTLFPMSLNSPSSPINTGKLPPSIGKYSSNDDYAVMDFSRVNRPATDSDYVNYNPAKPYKRTQSADYVPIMAAGRLTKENANQSNEKLFRPITESTERLSSSRPGSHRSLENLRGVEVESPSRIPSSSRPGSTSSEVSTIVGSRPPSVGNDPTRPPSATSGETQLCYASLELVKTEEDGSRSPRTLKSQSSDGGGSSAGSSGGGATVTEGDGTFTYAKIDFVRSNAPQYLGNSSGNTKVKH